MKKRYITRDQLRKLEALAYWIADKNYIMERFGGDDPEVEKCHNTIICIFDELDALGVSFLIQNIIICFAENWRQYKETYTRDVLESRGVMVRG